MAKKIAIEWNEDSLTVVEGNGVSTPSPRLDIRKSITVPLVPEGDEAKTTGDRVRETLRRAVEEHGLSKAETIVCVPRSAIEIRILQLPTVDPAERPQMVRFAAQRTFTQFTEATPTDFVVLKEEGASSWVMAAMVQPSALAKINAMCDAAGLSLSKVVVRSMQAGVFLGQDGNAGQACLFVIPAGNETDMVVVQDGKCLLTRTVRHSTTARMVGEIRRTLISSQSQNPSCEVSRIVCFDSELHQACLAGMAESKVEIAIATFGEFGVQESGGSSNFALATLLSGTADDDVDLIDFVNVKKPPEQKKPIGRLVVYGGLVAALLVAGMGAYFWKTGALNSEIEKLTKIRNDQIDTVETAQKSIDRWQQIVNFEQRNHQLLDELAFLSSNSLDSERVVFGSLNYTLSADPNDPNGRLNAQASFVSSEDRPELDRNLTDDRHVALSKNFSESQDSAAKFRFLSDPMVEILPPTREELTDRLLASAATIRVPEKAAENSEVDASDSSLDSDDAAVNEEGEPSMPTESDDDQISATLDEGTATQGEVTELVDNEQSENERTGDEPTDDSSTLELTTEDTEPETQTTSSNVEESNNE